jgi:uncharacterized protein (DUF1330 family)
MPAFAVMIRERMTDPEEFATYARMAGAARTEDLKALAFYGAFEVIEGPPAEGVVLIQFPTMDAAKAWYHSDAYQAAVKHRHAGAEYRVIFVEGL